MTSSSRLRVAPHLLVLHFCHGFGLTATLQPHVSCYDFLLPVFVSSSPFFVTLRSTVLFCSSCSCQWFFFGLNFISLLYFYSSSVLRFPPCLLLTFLPSVSFLFWITARSFVSLPARLGVASGSFAKRNEFTMILLYTPLSQRVSLFLK